MRHIFAIAWKEFRTYFTSPIAYVYLTTFLVLANWLFFRTFFLIGQADMRIFFGMMPWVFLFFIPAVAMGKWAEERKQGTLEVLFTLPVRENEIILAKFLAGIGLIFVALIMTLPTAFTVFLLGNMDVGVSAASYIGLIFMGGAYLSIGLMVSSLTENQIVAFIVGIALCFAMLIISTPLAIGGKGSAISAAIQYMGLATHFDSISRGVVDSRDIVYYLSVIFFFLYINSKILKTKARR